MRASSLATRLFLSATAWVVVILLITGIVLSSVYRNATERAFDRRLNLYLRTLIAEVATPDSTPETAPVARRAAVRTAAVRLVLADRPADGDKPEMRASRSLWDKKLPKLDEHGADLTAAGVRLGYVDGPEDQRLRMVERPVDLGDDGKFVVSVAGDATEIFDETRAFDYYLGGTFAALGDRAAADHDLPGALRTGAAQAHFGIDRRRSAPAAPNGWRANFPVEIAPLARETNALIDANREIVERARTHVGNLAHALKTPLSVIVNEAAARGADPFAAKVLEQTDVMRDQVAHHLERARIAARLTVVGTVTEVAPAIEALRRTMEKIHRDRGIAIGVKADRGGEISRRAAGPRGDGRQSRRQCLQMGGLAGVRSRCGWNRAPAPGAGPMLRIIVDDDGRGLSAAERAQVSRRGQRLDESKPGSGLGLSIVVDLAALYGGNLTLGNAPIGGLRAELVLPGV